MAICDAHWRWRALSYRVMCGCHNRRSMVYRESISYIGIPWEINSWTELCTRIYIGWTNTCDGNNSKLRAFWQSLANVVPTPYPQHGMQRIHNQVLLVCLKCQCQSPRYRTCKWVPIIPWAIILMDIFTPDSKYEAVLTYLPQQNLTKEKFSCTLYIVHWIRGKFAEIYSFTIPACICEVFKPCFAWK